MNISPRAKPHTLKSKGVIKTRNRWGTSKKNNQYTNIQVNERAWALVNKHVRNMLAEVQEQMFTTNFAKITLPLGDIGDV